MTKEPIDFFNFQFSWFLVPLYILIFIYFPNFRIYIQPQLYVVTIVGWIVNFKEPKHWWGYFLAFIGHLPCLLFLLWGSKYFTLNIYIWLLTIFGMFFIWYIPYWPYYVSRSFLFKTYNFTVISYFLLSLFFLNFKLPSLF